MNYDNEFCVCGHLKREHITVGWWETSERCLATEPNKCSCLFYRRAKRNDM